MTGWLLAGAVVVVVGTADVSVWGVPVWGVRRVGLGRAGLGRVGLGRAGLGRVGLGRVGLRWTLDGDDESLFGNHEAPDLGAQRHRILTGAVVLWRPGDGCRSVMVVMEPEAARQVCGSDVGRRR